MASKKYAIDFLMSDGSVKTVTFEVPESNISQCLLKNGTTPMEANLPMGGFKVTGLGTPAAEGDAVPLGYANQNFAPAGYGLGGVPTKQVTLSELDTLFASGWYWFNELGTTLNGVYFNYAVVFVHGMENGACRQEIRPLAQNVVLTRYASGGTFQPWECENPPMVPGVEYRTTERCNGAAVYKKRVSYTPSGTVGSEAGSGVFYFAHGISNFSSLVRIDGVQDGTQPFPVHGTNGGSLSVYNVNVSAVNILYYNYATSKTLVFDLHYTKTA